MVVMVAPVVEQEIRPVTVLGEQGNHALAQRLRWADYEFDERAEQEAARRAAEQAARARWVEQHGDVLADFASKGFQAGRS
jgi:hypothetical protein